MYKQEEIMEKVKVMCSYCQKIVEVDKDIADKLDETTAFCCSECLVIEPFYQEAPKEEIGGGQYAR